MKKSHWVVGTLIILLVVLCFALWQQKNAEIAKMESLCEGSAGRALEYFKEYKSQGNDADYIKGVAEFRSFMTAYLYLNNNTANAEYTWCNAIYGYMVLHPEEVQGDVQGLIEALEYLSTDYDDMNGFHLINTYSNELTDGGN